VGCDFWGSVGIVTGAALATLSWFLEPSVQKHPYAAAGVPCVLLLLIQAAFVGQAGGYRAPELLGVSLALIFWVGAILLTARTVSRQQ
jgi:hypothetical protein